MTAVRIAKRLLLETDPRLLLCFAYNMGWKGMRAIQRFERRKKNGDFFPAFVFISVTNDCNLRCRGCWVTPTAPPVELAPRDLDRIISESKKQGSCFFGILGGEPLLYKGLFDVLAKHRDCYFQVFSNGTLLTDEVAAEMRRLGNISPLISIEGLEQVSDERRGGKNVYARALDGVAACKRNRLLTGVATSVCRSNFDELVSDEFVQDLIDRGVHYLWYYIYRPAGRDPSPELALDGEQIRELRRFMVDARTRFSIIVVDAYWDHEGRALCPAAVGISHHIGPSGHIEPCPPIQFAVDDVNDGRELARVFAESGFLTRFRAMAVGASRGCVLLEDPDGLAAFVREEGAVDTSGRGCGLAELAAMSPQASHHQPGLEVPEKNWFYRFAKRHWFFGFGAYG